MRRRLSILIYLWSALLSCGTYASEQPKHLHLVAEPWAPYAYQQDGVNYGLDYELVDTAFQRMGITVEWEFLPWKRCLLMLEHGEADGILDMYRMPERETWLEFSSVPLSRAQGAMYYAKARPHPFTDIEQLRGLKIGVLAGYIYFPGFNDMDHFIREPAPTHEANFGKLLLGRVDMVISDRRVGHYVLAQMGVADQITVSPTPLSGGDLYLALRKGEGINTLMTRVSAEIVRFKNEPAYREISERYPASTAERP